MKKFLKFDKNKDNSYEVKNIYGANLGQIYYYNTWKKYVFEPYENTFFDKSCMKQLIEFMETLK